MQRSSDLMISSDKTLFPLYRSELYLLFREVRVCRDLEVLSKVIICSSLHGVEMNQFLCLVSEHFMNTRMTLYRHDQTRFRSDPSLGLALNILVHLVHFASSREDGSISRNKHYTANLRRVVGNFDLLKS